MALPGSNGHPQAPVDPGRQGEVVIQPGGKPLVPQSNRYGIAAALRPQAGLGRSLDLGQRSLQLLRFQPPGCCQHRVPHPELQGLVLLRIGIGHHMEPHQLPGQGLLLSLQGRSRGRQCRQQGQNR